MKTPERRQWRHSGVFIVNFEHILHLVLVFLLLTLNMYLPGGTYVFYELLFFKFISKYIFFKTLEFINHLMRF